MIVKILINGKEYGVDVYENNFDGEVQVNDTFHCEAEADSRDTIFGTNDQMVTVKISYEDIIEIIKKEMIEDSISILLSRGTGNTYDRDMAFDTAHDVLSDLKYEIADEVDNIMTEKYTCEDNLTIKGDDTMYEPQCKHNCADCAGYETTGDCNHGCHDCIHFDGGNCVNSCSNYYGCEGGECAADCHEWKTAYITYHKDDGDAYTY